MCLEQRRAIELRERYLAQVSKRLGPLEPIETYETIEELREHLNAMAAARQEMGLGTDEAMRVSTEVFGPAAELGESLLTAHSDRNIQHRLKGRVAAMVAIALTMLTSWVFAFCLFEAINQGAAPLFHYRPAGAWPCVIESFTQSALFSPLAWLLRGWKPPQFGVFAVFIGLALQVLDYAYIQRVGWNGVLVILAIMTSLLFVIAIVTSVAARYYANYFVTRLRAEHQGAGA